MKKIKIGVLFTSFVLLPIIVSAQATQISNSSLVFNRTLSVGMKGEDVKQIQKILASDSSIYPEGQITGYYGPLTEKAIKAFQKKVGLEEVGNIGKKTLAQFNSLASNSNNPVISGAAVSKQVISSVANTNVVQKTITQPDVPFKAPVDVPTSVATTTEHYIIRYKNTPTKIDEDSLKKNYKAQVRRTFKSIPAIAVDLDKIDYARVLADSNVSSIEVDKKIQVRDIEYDNTWGVARLGASTTFANGIDGQGIKIAVLDTGIDYTHPEFSAQYAGGYNFVTGTTDPMDDNGHGTHVAGIISAAHNGVGVVGVSPNVQLYALKVLDSTGSGYTSSVIAALDWAITNGVKITNNSYGSPTDLGIAASDAFAKAEQAGILSIASAGNAGTCTGDTDTVEYPARYSSVVAVSATDINNSRPCFSSTGPKIELSAPGVNIISTKLGGGNVVYNGTSLSAPHVAGTAVLIAQAGLKTNQSQTNTSIRQILNGTALDLGASGKDNLYGNGLVSADRAVAFIYSTVATTSPITSPTSSSTNPIATTTPITSPTATTSPIFKQPTATTTPISPIDKTPDTHKPSFPRNEKENKETEEYKERENNRTERNTNTNQSWHRTIPIMPTLPTQSRAQPAMRSR